MLVVTYSLSQILKLKTEVYYSAGNNTKMRAHRGNKNLFPGGYYLKQGNAEL